MQRSPRPRRLHEHRKTSSGKENQLRLAEKERDIKALRERLKLFETQSGERPAAKEKLTSGLAEGKVG